MSNQTSGNDWASPFDMALGDSNMASDTSSTPIESGTPIIGTPAADAAYWDGAQHWQDTCAIRCQECIIQQYTGQPITEGSLVQEAELHGWYQPGQGTNLEDVGNLLENHGIAVHRYTDANIFQLSNELAQGHKVIVGVDSGELWKDRPDGHPLAEELMDKLGIEQADHAVVVSGIDTSDPDNVQVIISDPGTGEVAARYPMDEFMDAWQDSHFYMVSTAEPAPAAVPGMENFDYASGHISQVWGMPYDQFQTLEDAHWEAVFQQYMEGSSPDVFHLDPMDQSILTPPSDADPSFDDLYPDPSFTDPPDFTDDLDTGSDDGGMGPDLTDI